MEFLIISYILLSPARIARTGRVALSNQDSHKYLLFLVILDIRPEPDISLGSLWLNKNCSVKNYLLYHKVSISFKWILELQGICSCQLRISFILEFEIETRQWLVAPQTINREKYIIEFNVRVYRWRAKVWWWLLFYLFL